MYGGYGGKSALGGTFAPWPRGWGSLLTRSHYKDIALRWKSRGLSVILRGRRRSDAILRIHLTIGFGCTGCILQWGSFLGRSRSDRAVLFRGRPRHPHGALQPLTFQERPPRAVFFSRYPSSSLIYFKSPAFFAFRDPRFFAVRGPLLELGSVSLELEKYLSPLCSRTEGLRTDICEPISRRERRQDRRFPKN